VEFLQNKSVKHLWCIPLLFTLMGQSQVTLEKAEELKGTYAKYFAFANKDIWVSGDEFRINIWRGYERIYTLQRDPPFKNGPFYFLNDSTLYAGSEVFDIKNGKILNSKGCKVLSDITRKPVLIVRDKYANSFVISSEFQPNQRVIDLEPEPKPWKNNENEHDQYLLQLCSKGTVVTLAKDDFMCVEISKKYIAAGGDGIYLWNKRRTRKKPIILDSIQAINDIKFNSDESLLGSAGWSGSVIIWDIKTKSALYKLPGDSVPASNISFHPTKQLLVTGDIKGKVSLWSYENSSIRLLQSLELGREIEGISFDKEGKRLFINVGQEEIVVYKINTN
jgi:WD40 repeat protein